MKLRELALAAAVLLAGCASAPDLRVHGEGAPLTVASFAPLDDADPAAARLAASELQARGWRLAEAAPRWRLEVLYSRRNAGAGAYAAEVRPQGEVGWTIPPEPRRWWRREGEERGLALALVDPATGRRVAQGEAWTRRPLERVTDDRLAAAAVEALLSGASVATEAQ